MTTEEERRLLKMAAYAAGIELDTSATNGGGAHNDGFDLMGDAVLDWHHNEKWNPLRNDGDALRLAVKLCMRITVRSSNVEIEVDAPGIPKNTWFCTITGGHGDDPVGDVRRSIVHAAAFLGERKNTREKAQKFYESFEQQRSVYGDNLYQREFMPEYIEPEKKK